MSALTEPAADSDEGDYLCIRTSALSAMSDRWKKAFDKLVAQLPIKPVSALSISSKGENLIGQKFSRWTVAGEAERGGYWECICECGATSTVKGYVLKRGKSRSCRECAVIDYQARRVAVNLGHPREHGIWRGMIQRCRNPNRIKSLTLTYYYGRGIRVCPRWLKGENGLTGFACFLADMGPAPTAKHSIDRIDNNGHYSPENCRWATWEMQAANRRLPQKRALTL